MESAPQVPGSVPADVSDRYAREVKAALPAISDVDERTLVAWLRDRQEPVHRARHLTVGEIVDQVRHWQRELVARGERVSHVVAMGMGEPLANFDATVAAVRMLIDPQLFGISPRRVTISTVGVVPQMDQLAALDLPMN